MVKVVGTSLNPGGADGQYTWGVKLSTLAATSEPTFRNNSLGSGLLSNMEAPHSMLTSSWIASCHQGERHRRGRRGAASRAELLRPRPMGRANITSGDRQKASGRTSQADLGLETCEVALRGRQKGSHAGPPRVVIQRPVSPKQLRNILPWERPPTAIYIPFPKGIYLGLWCGNEGKATDLRKKGSGAAVGDLVCHHVQQQRSPGSLQQTLQVNQGNAAETPFDIAERFSAPAYGRASDLKQAQPAMQPRTAPNGRADFHDGAAELLKAADRFVSSSQ